MSAHRHQRRHDHDHDHPRRGHRHDREDADIAQDNSAVIAQMGPAVRGPAPPVADDGPTVDMPDWAADLDEEGAAPAATWGAAAGKDAAGAFRPEPEAAVDSGGATSGGVAPAEGTGMPDPGGPVPAAVIAQVDAVLPPGLGVVLAASGSLAVAVGVSVGAEVTVVNRGGGWLDVKAAPEAGLGVGVGLGAEVLGEGASAGLDVGVGAGAEREFLVPWTRIVDPGVLGSLALGTAETAAVTLLAGRNLNPYLVKSTERLGLQAEAEAGVGVGGEELGLGAESSVMLEIGLAYDGLAAEGKRSGEFTVTGRHSALLEAKAALEQTVGASIALSGEAESSGTIVLPFTEEDGVRSWRPPLVRIAQEVSAGVDGVGGLGAGYSVETGLGHMVVGAQASVTAGTALWGQVVQGPVADAIGYAAEGATGEMTLGVEVDLSAALQVQALTQIDVVRWLLGGDVTPSIQPVLAHLQLAVANADVSLGVELELWDASREGEITEEMGAAAGLEGKVGAKVVFEKEDILPDLAAPPGVQEVLACLRAGAPTAA